jgi:hypothetical protein
MNSPANAAGHQLLVDSPIQQINASNNLPSATAQEIGTALSQFSDQPQAVIAA